MPLPVLEQIRQNVLATLGNISTATGYSFDAAVIEPSRIGEQTGDGVLVPRLGASERNPESNAGLEEWVQAFEIQVFVAQPEDNEAPADGQITQRLADVTRALMKDPTRGDLAHDTTPEPPGWFRRGDGRHEGVVAAVFVRYRHQWGDPFTIR